MFFSIVICTYNPNEQLLKEVVDAVMDQDFPKQNYEVIIIDNNSRNAVGDYTFIKSNPGLICRLEALQGLAFARITGIKATKSDRIVFVDDDNILSTDYLKNLQELVNKFPSVGVWGPGVINVKYSHHAPEWIRLNYASLFQEKNHQYTQYGSVVGWPDYYPAGSGMVVRKDILQMYMNQFEAGALTATGRKGNSLASAEDSQIVWTAVKMGLAAGTSPLLKLKHVIPESRLSRKYLAALNYGISSSYKAALSEMFPELKPSFTKRTLIQKFNFFIKMILRSKGNPLLFYRFYTVENGWFKGLEK